MTYRDDLDAAQARADALQREVDELRKRNAELEDTRGEQARRLELAKLREEAEQARRDAVRAAGDAAVARREADEAKGTTALVRTPRSMALEKRAKLTAAMVLSGIAGVAAAFAQQPEGALVGFALVVVCGIGLAMTRQSGR